MAQQGTAGGGVAPDTYSDFFKWWSALPLVKRRGTIHPNTLGLRNDPYFLGFLEWQKEKLALDPYGFTNQKWYEDIPGEEVPKKEEVPTSLTETINWSKDPEFWQGLMTTSNQQQALAEMQWQAYLAGVFKRGWQVHQNVIELHPDDYGVDAEGNELRYMSPTGNYLSDAFVQEQLNPPGEARWQKEFDATEAFRKWQMQRPAAEEALRQRLWEAEQMAELAGPSDWIKRWELGQGISRREVERNIAAIERDIMNAPRQPFYGPVTPGVPTAATANPEEYDIRGTVPGKAIFERAITPNLTRRLQEEEDRLERLKIEQTTAPAPAWLPQFVPSQTTGEPITKKWIRTPSMQLWNTTTPSEQAGLGGYAEWAGGRPLSDIYAHMMVMQPSPIRGAGSQRWQPVRQIY